MHDEGVDDDEEFLAFLARLSDAEAPESDRTCAVPQLLRGSGDYSAQPFSPKLEYDIPHVIVCCVFHLAAWPSSGVSGSTKLKEVTALAQPPDKRCTSITL